MIARIPEPIVALVLNDGASSDSQLAIYSQVCKTWRKAAVDTVVQHAMNGILAVVNPTRRLGSSRGGECSPVQDLLLTDMAKMLVLRRMENSRKQNDDNINVNQHPNKQGRFCLAWFAPSGIQMTNILLEDEDSMEWSDELGRLATPIVQCCHEWRGYRSPLEVLRPFGYDEKFVSEVFIAALKEATERGLLSKSKSEWHDTASPATGQQSAGASYDHHLPTFAVRGATLARPEGHCLCLDKEYIRHFNRYSQEETARCRSQILSRKHRMPVTIDEVTTRFKSRIVDLLPTVVVQGDGDDDDHQRCGVQFLSAEQSHATRLITPFFQCGGVEGPVTMFLVVDSDKEGCWVSGRNSRFEVGHRFTSHGEAHTVTLVGNHDDNCCSSDDDDEDDDDYDVDKPFQCLCQFQSDDPFRPKHLSEEFPSEDRIYRGCTSAGRSKVSCYCVVFDGKESMIRIDSMEETQRRVSRVSNFSHDIRYDPERNGIFVGSGVLNGLSLGADHQFDHSLSNDIYGSDTVLYELAVFSGRMNIEDIQKMEHHMMKKHGIVCQK